MVVRASVGCLRRLVEIFGLTLTELKLAESSVSAPLSRLVLAFQRFALLERGFVLGK